MPLHFLKVLLFLKVDNVHIAPDDLGLAGMFSFVFAEFAGVVVEIPRLRNLGSHEFDNDIHGAHTIEIIGEMRADAK